MNNQSDCKLPERVGDKKCGAVPASQPDRMTGWCEGAFSFEILYLCFSRTHYATHSQSVSGHTQLIKLCAILSVLHGHRETVYICNESVFTSEVFRVGG